MVQTITEKTGLPLGMVVALVTVVVAITGFVLDTRAKADRNSTDIAKMEVMLKDAAKELQTVTIRTQRNEDNYATILTALGKLEVKFDRVLTVRPARGGR